MKTIKVYQTENDYYKDMKLFGKLKYVGKSFGAVSLTNNKIYDCVGYDEQGWVQIVDDSDELQSEIKSMSELFKGVFKEKELTKSLIWAYVLWALLY